MNWAWAELVDRSVMLRRGISLMRGKTVAGIKLVQFHHDAVASYFGEDAGGGNRVTLAIPVHKGGLRIGQPLDSQPINKNVLRPRIQLVERKVHRAPGSLADIDL